MTNIEIDEGSAAQPHPAAPGDSVIIRLPESPMSGYRWQLDDFDPGVLQPAGDEFVSAVDALTGGGGTREFRFVVLSPDQSEVTLSLRRSWAADTAAEHRFRTTIN
jgi:inhibitor of cysteine peptidase